MAKNRIRILVDIAMTVLLPMLMAYSLTGEKFHEIIGTLMFALFILHHILNRKWYGSIFKGKYNTRRTFQTTLDVLLTIFMIAQPISGILMSKHLYTFIQVQGVSAIVREIHLCLAYWGFVLVCVHAGTHLLAQIKTLKEKKKYVFYPLAAIGSAISAYGIYAFVKRQFPNYMLRKTAFVFFDYSEPRIFFFMDYLAVMILFILIGCLIVTGLTKLDRMRIKRKGGEA